MGGIAVGSSRHRIQQLSRILEVALPEQRGTFAGQAIGYVGCHAVVGDGHACGRWRSPLRAPARGASLACLDPAHKCWPAHDSTVRAIIAGRSKIPEFIVRLGIWSRIVLRSGLAIQHVAARGGLATFYSSFCYLAATRTGQSSHISPHVGSVLVCGFLWG